MASGSTSAMKDANDTPISLKRMSSSTEPPASNKKKIRRTFKKLEIEGDGNCLFRAFSQHFNGVENQYEGVRLMIVKYVEKNWAQFQPKVESVLSARLARSARQYASYMGKDKTFGSEVEILAASLLFKTPIRVYLKKAKRFLPIYESGIKEDATVGAVGVDGNNVLFLEYDEDNLHYNVLVPIAVETQMIPAGAEEPAPATAAAPAAAAVPTPVSISSAASPSAASPSCASPLLPSPGRDSPTAPPPSLSPAVEPRVTPKALFVNKSFNSVNRDDSILSNASPKIGTSSAKRSSARETPTPPPSRGSRSGTPTKGTSAASASPAAIFLATPPESTRPPSSPRGTTPIVVRDCYVPLPRTGAASAANSRRSSVDAASVDHSAVGSSGRPQQQQQQHVKHRPSPQQPRVMALCLCSTRDPAFITPITRAAKRHLSLYENIRKRQVSYRVTRMRSSDGAGMAHDVGIDGRATDADGGSAAGNKTYSKDVVLWPYLLHSLPDLPNEIFLYHLLFCLFAASQDADEAFTILARYVFFLQRDEIDKYLTAYNLEFTSHDEETLQKILSHYRKSLKRDVAALRKEWVDMYFAHEEIDHPCRPTDLSSRQNCVIFVLDSRNEEHQRLLARLCDHLPYLWKRSPTPLVNARGIPTTISLQSLNSIVDLAVDSLRNDYVDSIVHHHPTKNSVEREIKVLTHHLAISTDNSFQLSVYPKDSLFVDGATSLISSSLFLLRDRLLQLAQQSEDLLTFERHQVIGDRIADTHLLEAASARYRVGICLPTEEWVEASVFFEKAMGDLLYSMKTTNDADRGFLFLPALNRSRRPFHPFVDGAPLRRLAREAQYRVDILTAAAPAMESVAVVLVQITKNAGAS